MSETPVFAHFYRYLHQAHGLILVRGELGPVLDAWTNYHRQFGIAPLPTEVFEQGRRVLAGAILGAMSGIEAESWGWTLTLDQSPVGFFCAVEPEGFCSLRHRDAESSRKVVVLQRQRGTGPLRQSNYTPQHNDPLRVIEDFFEVSEQIPTRLALGEDGRCALVQELPGGDFSQLAQLDDHALLALVERWAANEAPETLEKLYWYGCRCDEQWLRGVLEAIPPDQEDEWWGEKNLISIECPRCGRGFVLARDPAPSGEPC